MAAPTVRTSVVRRWICFVAAVGFLAAGCATGSGAESGDEKVAEEAPPRPGTDRWSGAALHLPEGAPIAVEMRPDDLLASAQGLRRWIAAEPQMFGERGDQIVAQMRAFWGMMEQRMGTDPFSPRAARKLGIDASRPVYVGLYPASAGGSGQFVTAVERTLRERLEVGEDGDLLEALLAVERGERSAPRGLHRDVLNAVESLQPWTGMRVLVPTKEAPELVGRIATLARFGGYRAVDSNGEGDASAPRVWVNPKSQWEAFSVRRVGSDSEERGWIRVDVLFRQWEPRASLAESVDEQVAAARRALQSLSETVPS
ncbi:MAG: hypothetical protein ABEL76_09525, partial [Bradymonadaceae bacterium]